MQGFQGIGVAGLAVFTLTSLVIGVRLIALFFRTRQLPELAMGLSFVLPGFLATGMNLIGIHVLGEPHVAMWLRLVSTLTSYTGYGLMACFVWRVFRRDALGAAAFAACAALLAAGLGIQIALARPVLPPPIDTGFWVGFAGQVAAYAWATAESFRYWALLRRRARIGLAEPAMVNRFFMWGVGNAAVLGIWAEVAASMVGHESAVFSDASYLRVAGLGFACAAAIWLAFFPPRAWARLFERGREDAGAA
jgi:hypothetical protein